MKINWCVISFKFNFLGEATFKTLPDNPNGEIFLIHTGKAAEISQAFDDRGLATLVAIDSEQLSHGQWLDRILRDRLYPEILDCDWLVMIDHDIYIKDQAYFLQLIDNNCSLSNEQFAIIGCENHWVAVNSNFPRYFLTTPLMMINNRHPWHKSLSWNFVVKIEKDPETNEDAEFCYDTGQWLAKKLGPQRIKCYPKISKEILDHFSSEWLFMSNPYYKEHEFDRFDDAVSAIKTKFRDRLFVPDANEFPVMRNYLFLREVLDQLDQEGFQWT